MHNRVPPSQLVIYNPRKQVRQLQVRNPLKCAIELDKMTVVVSIDGACRNNGKALGEGVLGRLLLRAWLQV